MNKFYVLTLQVTYIDQTSPVVLHSFVYANSEQDALTNCGETHIHRNPPSNVDRITTLGCVQVTDPKVLQLLGGCSHD